MILEDNVLSQYLPILIQLGFAAGFVITTMIVSHLWGPKVKTKRKNENFESGIDNQGNARTPVSVRFFLTAVLFVLFDVEVIFMYPWAVNLRELGWTGMISMGIFLSIFMIGFFYILRRGALKWE